MKRGSIVATVSLAAMLAISSCGAEREYALPEKVCGVQVAPELTAAFLPPGKNIVQRHKDFGIDAGVEGCAVYVDNHVVLSSRGEWRAVDVTPMDAALVAPGADLVSGGKFALWERGAATVVSCHAPSKAVVSEDEGKGEADFFALEVHVPVPDEGTEAAMKEFIGPYAKAYRETLPCVEE